MKKLRRILLLTAVLLFAAGTSCVFAASGLEQVKTSGVMEKAFQTIYNEGHLKCENPDLKIEANGKRAILISGKNEQLAETKLTIDENFDFGDNTIKRIQAAGLGDKDADTKLSVYIDNQTDPIAVLSLPERKDDSKWAADENVSVDVSRLGITGTHSVQIRACQYSGDTPAASGDAEIYLRTIQFVADSVPVVTIDIDESKGTIEAMNSDDYHQTMCYGSITIDVPSDFEGGYDDSYTGGTYEMEYIKGRGNSTWNRPKKPYKIKLEDSKNLFGMGKNKHWALLANDMDHTLVRNAFTYLLGEKMDFAFTPQSVSVDVIMNGRYLGSYTLCETVRVGKNRVDIDNLEDDTSSITGGYLLGASSENGVDEGSYGFFTKHGMDFSVNTPFSEDSQQFEKENKYIENYMQRVEYAIYGEENPETGTVEDPFELMDLDSAVKYYWVQELSENMDFFVTGSTYLYKERDGKLYWGPLWDFDMAWRDADGLKYPDGTYKGEWKSRIKWFQPLLKNEIFRNAAVTYWNETLYPELSDMLGEGGAFDKYTDQIAYSAASNFWTNGFSSLVEYGFPGADGESGADYEAGGPERKYYEGADYDDKYYAFMIDPNEARDLYLKRVAHLKKAMIDKMNWCNANLDSIESPVIHYIFRSEGEIIAEGQGYYEDRYYAIPEEPQSKDPDKQFAGWYKQSGFNGQYSLEKIEDSICISKQDNEIISSDCTIYIDAKYLSKDQTEECEKINFEKSSYKFVMPSDAEEADMSISYSIDPENANPLELYWKVADPTVLALEIYDNELKVIPLKPGNTTIRCGNSSVSVIIDENPEKPSANPFEDVAIHRYYYNPVLWAAEKKITNGVDSTHFAPEESCTRAQAVTLIWRAAGSPEVSAENPFTDVSEDAYYYKAVLWAVENKITEGKTATEFDPKDNVTRAEMITFLYRSKGLNNFGTNDQFEDVAEDAYYAEAVCWAVVLKITTGTSETQFSPDDSCTRAQIVTFLYRLWLFTNV